MARTRSAVYRTVGSVRRTPVPRTASAGAGLTSSFGRMLTKLAMASDALERSRPKRRR